MKEREHIEDKVCGNEDTARGDERADGNAQKEEIVIWQGIVEKGRSPMKKESPVSNPSSSGPTHPKYNHRCPFCERVEVKVHCWCEGVLWMVTATEDAVVVTGGVATATGREGKVGYASLKPCSFPSFS